ncbi:molecular chaperone [Aeromonas salmonicida]|uniref:fimbrial biogenesis chaperone n=1 Tax=Aeromonas salmonicida TaxID=645 RepID=UPI002796B94A|nr:molecular chaperone [Aeromonas salmonicida]MDQ1886082.1 molecular chaperone [Aeromonas salmonicida]
MKKPIHIISGLTLLLASFIVNASIQLSSTRLIFEEHVREASVTVRNKGDTRLIQSWLDKDQPDQAVPPFAVTPPLAKLDKEGQQLLRIHYAGQGLPDDRESMYWLAVQEIPQKAQGANVVQFAVQQRIKVFYRPMGLAGKAIEAPKALTLTLAGGQLTLNNPTPYFINLASVEAGAKGLGGEAIAPFGQLSLPARQLQANDQLELIIVNDFGAHQRWQGQLSQGRGQPLTLKKA